MSSPDDNELFGSESEEEAPRPVPTRKRKRKLPKNPIIAKLVKQVKQVTDTNQQIEDAVRAQRTEKEEEGFEREARPKKQRVLANSVTESMRNPILVRENDLEDREKHDPDLAKIQREIWVKRTRYYPFNIKCNHDLRSFYTTPTDLCCMHCTLPVDDIPIPLPIRYSPGRNAFYVSGQYCSLPCMLSQSRKKNVRPTASFFMSRVYGIKNGHETREAPSPHLLTKFGGPMTPTMYRNTIKKPNLSFSETALPFIPFAAGIEEVERVKTVIYEYGDETKVNKVVNSSIVVSRPIPIENSAPRRMQVSKFSKMPTLEEQIAQSERKLRLQMQETGMGDDGAKKKRRTLRDFMNIKSNK